MTSFTAMPKYEAYKDSGVEWLGDIPSHWNCLSNKNIFKIRKSLVGKHSSEYELLSLTLRGIIKRDMDNPEGKFPAEFNTYQEVRVGDFVFCLFDVEETPRTVGLSDFNGMITGAYTVFEVNNNFDKKFLYYFYLNLDQNKRLKPLYRGLRNTIPKDSFMAFKSFVPSKIEQTAIANFLDEKTVKIDEAIAIKEKQIELLKERKQIIIQQAVTQGLDPTVPMKDSGVEWIGKIPAHWSCAKLKLVCNFILDGTHGSYPRVDKGYRLLSVRNIINDEFVFRDDDSNVSYKHFKEISSKFKIVEGDIQLAIVGATLGKVAVVKRLEEDVVTQRSLATIRVNSELINNSFVANFLRSKSYEAYLWSNTSFSAQPGVYLNTIQNSYIPLAPKSEQDLIDKYIDDESKKLNGVIENTQTTIDKLREYKTTLINSAVTGKIKVV